MPDWPLISGQRIEAAGIDSGNSRGSVVTAGGSAHTKGSYVQLIASTADESFGLVITAGWASATMIYAVDIAIGGSGSEQIIVPDLWAIIDGNSQTSTVYIPIQDSGRFAHRRHASRQPPRAQRYRFRRIRSMADSRRQWASTHW